MFLGRDPLSLGLEGAQGLDQFAAGLGRLDYIIEPTVPRCNVRITEFSLVFIGQFPVSRFRIIGL